MASSALQRWRQERARELDEIATAHAEVGGSNRGRRYATQQINQAYALMVSSQFQGFCRDLQSECVAHLVRQVAAPFRPMFWSPFVFGRKLDRGNPTPDNIGADFNRLGIKFWRR